MSIYSSLESRHGTENQTSSSSLENADCRNEILTLTCFSFKITAHLSASKQLINARAYNGQMSPYFSHVMESGASLPFYASCYWT